jgi:hypothetical protein
MYSTLKRNVQSFTINVSCSMFTVCELWYVHNVWVVVCSQCVSCNMFTQAYACWWVIKSGMWFSIHLWSSVMSFCGVRCSVHYDKITWIKKFCHIWNYGVKQVLLSFLVVVSLQLSAIDLIIWRFLQQSDKSRNLEICKLPIFHVGYKITSINLNFESVIPYFYMWANVMYSNK